VAPGSNGLAGMLPEVCVEIEDADLEREVLQRLRLSGDQVRSSDRSPRRQNRRTAVIVCDATYLARARARHGGDPCVAVVRGPESGDARRALAAGAAGIVFAENLAALEATVAAVAVGQLAVPSSLRTAITKPILTTREKQILALVVMGLSNREIADQLFVAESTVKSHLFSAFRRLGVRTRKEAAALILDDQQGLGSGILAITR
jgi:DNA-binding NarL/FixJ family response regulator